MALSPLEVLLERTGPATALPGELRRLYGGDLDFAEPCLVANFVQTIDGVVAIPDLPASNALIAGKNEADRFVMGLLRALADVVLVGSGTMLASPTSKWLPERVYPPAAAEFAELRRARCRPAAPTIAFVTGGGSFDPRHPALRERAIVLTTEAAAADIRANVPETAEVVAVNDGDRVDLRRAVESLHERGHSLIVSEGGPTLFGALVAASVADELFLTISPVLAGRGADPWLPLVTGVELLPGAPVAGELRSVRRHDGHLFLRYGLRGAGR